MSTREWCSYSLDEDWDGKEAYARIPMPGLDEERKKVYRDYLDIWKKVSDTERVDGPYGRLTGSHL